MKQRYMPPTKCISVIIPCYNEEKVIRDNYYLISNFLDKYRFSYEIIYINDGSTDKTLEKLRSIDKNFNGVNIISYKKNVGKGYAVFRGLCESNFKTKLILDADLSVSITELFKLNWNWVINQPVIKGQRVQVIRQPFYRILLGKAWKLITYYYTGLYMDTQCPFMILNLDDAFYWCLGVKGFAFDVEILAKAKKEGHHINMVTVEYLNNEDSSVSFGKMIKMFLDLRNIKKKI